jgi:hypothetical protein
VTLTLTGNELSQIPETIIPLSKTLIKLNLTLKVVTLRLMENFLNYIMENKLERNFRGQSEVLLNIHLTAECFILEKNVPEFFLKHTNSVGQSRRK